LVGEKRILAHRPSQRSSVRKDFWAERRAISKLIHFRIH